MAHKEIWMNVQKTQKKVVRYDEFVLKCQKSVDKPVS